MACLACGAGAQPVVINEIFYEPPDKTVPLEFVELHNPGAAPVDLSGWYFSEGISYAFPEGAILQAGGYLVVAEDPQELRRAFGNVPAFGPFAGKLSNDGERLTLRDAGGALADHVAYGVGFPWPLAPAGRGSSLELINPSLDRTLGGSWRPSRGNPTPAARNSVYAQNAPPQIRQVAHTPVMPTEAQNTVITARVTDPDGVASVTLMVQVVSPGNYVPAYLPVPLAQLMTDASQPRPANPAFEDPAAWHAVPMVDNGTGFDAVAGDGIYTGFIARQENRALVRYRITARDALGNEVRVPYDDDPSLNFAYYTYNGVPPFHAAHSILGEPTVHSVEALTSVAVYTLITRREDITQAIAANPADQIPQGNDARFAFNWGGTFVYDGIVYDHIRYRLRGANGRYQVPPTNPSNVAGKRHWRFRFNKGHYLRARDRFGRRHPTTWKVLNTGRMFGNRLDGNWGLNDQVNDVIWSMYGVPAAFGHVFHWRVVCGRDEAPPGPAGQYLGDFWGIARAFENYDGRFLEARNLPKGNLYKLVNQTTVGLEQMRYQSPFAVTDGSDHDTIERNLGPNRSDAWLHAHVNYDMWYRYHALAQAFRHYDYWPSANKNAAWYFEPDYRPENGYLGRMWTLPFDCDATWGPTWNEGKDRPYDAIYGGAGKPEFQKAYRNAIREVRDLLWQRDQLELVIRQTAAFMAAIETADIDRWRDAPPEAGRQYFAAPAERSVEGKALDMLRFAFTGGSWPGGSVGAGGRAAFLDSFADGPDSGMLPHTPHVTYTGPAGYPVDRLTFMTSAFSDPQGAHTFKALQWRLGEVSAIANPGATPLTDPVWREAPVALELQAVWMSDLIAPFEPAITIPPVALRVGARYRVRARMQDNTDRWSHWSAPFTFTAGAPSAPIPEVEDLRITEIMYAPRGGSDFEFVELQNRGARVLDLRHVRFTRGIDFDFGRDAAFTTLGPGEIIVVVRNLPTFATRYDMGAMRIAGEYSGRLDNSGDRVTLTYGAGVTILDFTYESSWYPETAGLGHSLNIVDIDAPPDAWRMQEAWFPSAAPDGTPGSFESAGELGGFILPGDVNLDSRLDVSDAVALLRALFAQTALPLPCEGWAVNEGGNLALLDLNGDGAVNIADVVALLAYLYANGPPHALGTTCTRILLCPNACLWR